MKKIVGLICLLAFIISLTAQTDFSQYNTPYAGVHGLSFNPAEIVDSRYKIHYNLFSIGMYGSNDFVGLSNQMISLTPPNIVDSNRSILLPTIRNGAQKNAFSQVEIKGPSLLFTLNNKNAFAISTGVKVLATANNLSEKVAGFMYNSKDTNFWVKSSSIDMGINATAWSYIGLSYGRVLFAKNRSFLKAAATIKANIGLASISLTSPNMYIDILDSRTIKDLNGSYNLQYSQSFYTSNGQTNKPGFSLSNLGFGTDIGLIYELRDKKDYTYEMDCKTDNVINDKNKYLIRFGASITDLGFVNFKSQIPISSFKSDSALFNINQDKNKFSKIIDGNRFRDSLNTLIANGIQYDTTIKDFTFYTPSKLNLFVDAHIWKGFYVAANASLGFIINNQAASWTRNSYASFTPRFESKALGLYLPIMYDMLAKEVNIGAGLRFTVFNLALWDWSWIAGLKSTTKTAGINFGVSIPFRMRGKLKDSDGDLISNKNDKCKNGIGDCESGGCPNPDDDDDGVENKIDKCPNVKGPKELDGCPDSDGDGITDKDDQCPKNKGTRALGGCPDTDGDGIIDKNDQCLKEKGLIEFSGCPDTDHDWIPDNKDECPLDSGISENRGCPPVAPSDMDQDGIIDEFDACPTVYGAKDNKGCPKQDFSSKEKAQQTSIFDDIHQNLQFLTGSSQIKTISFVSLNVLVDYLLKNPAYKLKIDGHTDNQGNIEKNKILSIQRAHAVKTYLQQRGIDPTRIEANGHGDTQPIADNNSESGRAANRRVDFTILK